MNGPVIQGFSLIELLTTLAIVAILATITVPTFSSLVAGARRSDAISALVQVQLAQERWRARNPAYAPDLATLGWAAAESPEGHYRLRVGHADAGSYLATAQPLGVQRSDACGVFAIRATGPHHGPGFADRSCWKR